MDVTLLYFENCPSWRAASAHLETLAEERAGLIIRRPIVDTPIRPPNTTDSTAHQVSTPTATTRR